MEQILKMIELEKRIFKWNRNQRLFSSIYSNNWHNKVGKYADISGISENNLSFDEGFFIYLYTGSASNWINSTLCCNKKLNQIEKVFYENLQAALSKVKKMNNTILYRMDNVSNHEDIANYKLKIGSILSIPWFLSTSLEDYENSNFVWIIETNQISSKAHDISNITNNKSEKEVLFEAGSKFVINGIKISTVKNILYLREIMVDEL